MRDLIIPAMVNIRRGVGGTGPGGRWL